MKAYTYSSYANYAHLHMYLIGKRFEQEIVKNHLDQENYNFNISIDENVVTWEFSTDNRKIVNILSRTISNQIFSEAEIQNAVKEIAKKIHCTFEIKDLKKLNQELSHIQFTTEKPLKTDDSLIAPYLIFTKRP